MDGIITRLEISGYKSFESFGFELKPFTVIAGVNGVGKSNLFDALRHLSNLSNKTLRESFETQRGSLFDLFTMYPDGKRLGFISYAVEMLLPATVVDQFAESATLKYRRVRYELEIVISDEGVLSVKKERLVAIRRETDTFYKKNKELIGALPQLTGGRAPFIDTTEGKLTISQDGGGGKRTVSSAGAQRTVLSSIQTAEFPHAYAVRRLFETIHYLQLNPEKLRKPSALAAPAQISSDGDNLAAVIARIKKDDDGALQMISNDLASVIPSVGEVCLNLDTKREEYSISIKHTDGYEIPSKLLSDGTLRILALVVMNYDPEFSGVIILEEPENGVHPGRIPEIVSLLAGMTRLSDSLRQVIVNTHSTKLIDYVKFEDYLAIAIPKKRISSEHGNYTVTQMGYVPKGDSSFVPVGEALYLREELRRILEEKDMDTVLSL